MREHIHFTFEGQGNHINGYTIWIETICTIVFNEGKYNEIHGITRRIDDRIEAQELLLKQHENLIEMNNTKNMLFSIISHDLRNPFAALLNIAEVLAGHFDKMDKHTFLRSINIILNSANHIYRLLENLLMWSNSQNESLSYKPQKILLSDLLFQTIDAIEIQAKQKNIELVFLPTEELKNKYIIFADENMISTVLRNLISNSIKYSFEHSKILINIDKYIEDNKYLLVWIQDFGVGIPKNKINNIFKIKSMASTRGTKNESGTGLGLIIVKEFLDRHNCKIWVNSEVGKGTTFNFTVPNWKQHNKLLETTNQNSLD